MTDEHPAGWRSRGIDEPLYTLYAASTSNSLRASIALQEFGIPHRVQHVDLRAGEHRTPEHATKSFSGKIPLLVARDVAGGHCIPESSAILLYCAAASQAEICRTASSPEILSWLSFGCSTLGPAVSVWYRFAVREPDALNGAAELIWTDVEELLDRMEAVLSRSEQGWLSGRTYSIADIACYPVIALVAGAGHLASRPYLADWFGKVGSREPVKRGVGLEGLRPAALKFHPESPR